MDRYLLDTNIVSDLLKNPDSRVADRVHSLPQGQLCTSVIVAAELRYGIAKRGGRRLTGRVSEFLDTIEVVALDVPVDRIYGDLRATLERAGRLIGPNDLFIAAQALALGCTLVTDNEREFSRIPGLAFENWLRR